MEFNKRNRNIRHGFFRDSNLKKLGGYLVLQSIIFLYFCYRFSKPKRFFSVFGPTIFYIFGRFVKTKCRTFLRMAHWVIVIKLSKNSFGIFLKFKNDRIKVWWTGIRYIVISIISNINVTIFKQEVTDVNVKKKWSQYRTLKYTEKNLNKRAERGIYFGSLFLSFQNELHAFFY